MSLMKTLAKVAIGTAAAKGVRGAMRKRSGSGGGLLGGLTQGGSAGGGSLQGMLRSALSGRSGQSGQSGGLGGLLESFGGVSGAGAGATAGAAGARHMPQRAGFGDKLNQSLDSYGEPGETPNQQDEETAALMLRAMLQAAKADGKIDAGEKERLLDNIGEVTREESDFIDAELRKPVDVDALARDVPQGSEAQVYTMSVMAIDLDNQAEADYLHSLAGALGLGQDRVDEIHRELGAPTLYS